MTVMHLEAPYLYLFLVLVTHGHQCRGRSVNGPLCIPNVTAVT